VFGVDGAEAGGPDAGRKVTERDVRRGHECRVRGVAAGPRLSRAVCCSGLEAAGRNPDVRRTES
jgi:hypothetical protein